MNNQASETRKDYSHRKENVTAEGNRPPYTTRKNRFYDEEPKSAPEEELSWAYEARLEEQRKRRKKNSRSV